MLNKFFLALGTGDGNLTFSFGYPHLLMAAGAIVVTVILILQLLEEQQELPVFIIPLVNIPGQSAANSQDHEAVRDHGKQQFDRSKGHQHRQEGKTETCTQDRHIQFVCAVATCHKLPQAHTDFSEKSVHILLLKGESFLYYSQ